MERLLARWEEGPDAPLRLGEIVLAFANMYPKATRAEWVRFATLHAAECYRSGYVRGYEHVERLQDMGEMIEMSEAVADRLDPNWRWQPGITLEGKADAVPQDEVLPTTELLFVEMVEESMRR
jgi:hypothetical protein